MTDFRPYEEESLYKAVITEGEALLIQEKRKIKFGTIKVHISGGKITRLETTSSEIMKEKKQKDKILFDLISEKK